MHLGDRRFLLMALLALAGGVEGCAETGRESSQREGPYVRGTARVISVDQILGQAVLEYEGKRVFAYWQTETTLAQGGTVATLDPLKPPVGQYREPLVRPQALNAQPGDKIQFAGMWTGNDIFLRSVAVVGK